MNLASEKAVIFYVDDNKFIVDRFRYTVENKWKSSEFIVKSNSQKGKVDSENKDRFIIETLKEIEVYGDKLACILLDLDYSGDEHVESSKVSNTDIEKRYLSVGLEIGKQIRKKWPFIPIFIASHFSREEKIIDKGLIYDFDALKLPVYYSDLAEETFVGLLFRAKKKREALLMNIPSIPVRYLNGTHTYFRKQRQTIPYEKLAFVAMPFDENIVKGDVFHMGIKSAIREAGLQEYRVDEHIFKESIMDQITSHLFGAKVVIADITEMNPNVMFELGLAISCNKDVIIIQRTSSHTDIPFDLRNLPIIFYDENQLTKLSNSLIERLKDIVEDRKF